jgi:hypothetical protein
MDMFLSTAISHRKCTAPLCNQGKLQVSLAKSGATLQCRCGRATEGEFATNAAGGWGEGHAARNRMTPAHPPLRGCKNSVRMDFASDRARYLLLLRTTSVVDRPETVGSKGRVLVVSKKRTIGKALHSKMRFVVLLHHSSQTRLEWSAIQSDNPVLGLRLPPVFEPI